MRCRQRILVVDDDRSIVKVLRGYLEQAGYAVLTAVDGESALHVLRHERPDLVVLDLMMPGPRRLGCHPGGAGRPGRWRPCRSSC